MMLVEHDIEAQLVGKHMLIQIALVQIGADLRVIKTIGNTHPHGIDGVHVRQVGVGHFGEVPATHVYISLSLSLVGLTAASGAFARG